MHLRRIASFVLGAWIIGSVFAIYIAAHSGLAADKIMRLPPPQVIKMVQTLGEDPVRMLLRYEGGEQTHLYLQDWGRLQLLLGPALLLLLAASTHNNRLTLGLCGAMIVFAAFSHLVLIPEIEYLAGGLNFAPGWSANRARYLALRGTFTGLEVLKLALGSALAAYLFLYKMRRPLIGVDEDEHAVNRSPAAG
jgi:hypothetical protein